MKNIGVLGACDTAGVVATLQTIVPETTHVEPTFSTSAMSPRSGVKIGCPRLVAALQRYDRIFVSTAHEASIGVQNDIPISYYPSLVFNAFHPDIVYV